LKRLLFLFIFIASLMAASCIPAAIGVAGWYSLTIKDEKQILADKSECEEKAINIIEGRKAEIQARENAETKISAIDQIFQKEFTSCMKAKTYYKAHEGIGTKAN
jgi:hypothetical protein